MCVWLGDEVALLVEGFGHEDVIFPRRKKALKRSVLSILQDFVQVNLLSKLQRNDRKQQTTTIPDEKKKKFSSSNRGDVLSENFLVEAYRDLLDIEELLIKLNILSAEVHQCETGSRKARELVQNSKRDLALLRKKLLARVKLIQKARKKRRVVFVCSRKFVYCCCCSLFVVVSVLISVCVVE